MGFRSVKGFAPSVAQATFVSTSGSNAFNFRKDVESGNTLYNTFTGKGVQEPSASITQAPVVGSVGQKSGIKTALFSKGVSDSSVFNGMETTSLLEQNSRPQSSTGATIGQITYSGKMTRWVSSATNTGDDDWSNPSSAIGQPDGASATRSGQTLSSTSAALTCTFEDFGNKGVLNIDKVELRFYVSQTGTVLNNGGLSIEWRLAGEASWRTLATYANNQNFVPNPDVYDLTSLVSDWDSVNMIEARVRCELSALSGANCSVDAIVVYVEGSLVE